MPVAHRNDPVLCPAGGAGHRVFSVPVIHWPRSLWTQWSDVHTESPRELAHRADIERYDPSGPVARVVQDTRPALRAALDESLARHGRPEGMP